MTQTIHIPRSGIAIIGVLFLMSRILLASLFQPTGSDTAVYGMYALENREALNSNTTLYDSHVGTIEYPPLAVWWMSFPMLFVDDNKSEGATQDTFLQWKSIFRYLGFAFDTIIFLTLLLLLLRSANSPNMDIRGLVLYFVTGLLLFNFLYDRLDIFLGGIIFMAFILLMSNIHWAFSFVLLAVGINFKLIPILLVPLFLIGSLPGKYHLCFYKYLFNRELVIEVLKRISFLILATLLIFLPFYIWGGKHTLDFFSYHTDRGVQLESTYSSILMMLHYIGFPVRVTHGFGAFNINSLFAPAFSGMSSILILVSVIGIFFYFIRRIKSDSRENEILDHHSKTLAQSMPQTFLCLTIATLLTSIAFSKVFSPQYLLWVMPLFGLLSFRTMNAKIAGFLFVIVCLLTALIYPYLYFTEFVHHPLQAENGQIFWEAPTMLASNILFFRNMSLIATVLFLLDTTIQNEKIEK